MQECALERHPVKALGRRPGKTLWEGASGRSEDVFWKGAAWAAAKVLQLFAKNLCAGDEAPHQEDS